MRVNYILRLSLVEKRKKSTKNSKKTAKLTVGVLLEKRAPWQQKKETLKTKKKR